MQAEAQTLGKANDAVVADRLTRLEIELLALEHMELQLLARSVSGENPGPEASKLKIRGTEIAQALSRLRIDLHADACLVYSEAFLDAQETSSRPEAAGAMATYLNQRKLTIWGGSNEVQRMILAKQILELG